MVFTNFSDITLRINLDGMLELSRDRQCETETRSWVPVGSNFKRNVGRIKFTNVKELNGFKTSSVTI